MLSRMPWDTSVNIALFLLVVALVWLDAGPSRSGPPASAPLSAPPHLPAGAGLRRHRLPRLAGPARRARPCRACWSTAARRCSRARCAWSAPAGPTPASTRSRQTAALTATSHSAAGNGAGRAQRAPAPGDPRRGGGRRRRRIRRPPRRVRQALRLSHRQRRRSPRRCSCATPGTCPAASTSPAMRAALAGPCAAVTTSARSARRAGRGTDAAVPRPRRPRAAAGRSRWRIVISADRFLHHMVRNLVGSAVEVGRGARDPGWMAEVLASRDRTLRRSHRPRRTA